MADGSAATSGSGDVMTDSGWLLFAIIVWASVLGLLVPVLRLVRGRPFWKNSEKDHRRARHY
jgi:hypothetical protein